MKQTIMCQKGKCFEADTKEHELESLFQDTNIVGRINRDIFNNRLW